jgi:trimeric autotransporter adhesin
MNWYISRFAALAFIGAAVLLSQDSADRTYTVRAFAGAAVHDLGDGSQAIQGLLWSPRGVSVDAAGNLLIADTGHDLVRRVASDGTISTIAGNFADIPGGDGGQATQALLAFPYRVVLSPAGGFLVADAANNRIRRVSRDGVITTVAGNGQAGSAGDGGLATAAQLNSPRDMVADSRGNIYILDTNNSRVRRVTSAGVIQAYAGTGQAGFSGDNGPATSALLNYPLGLAIDSRDNLYIADTSNHRVRVVSPDGTITTLTGSSIAGFSGDNQPASNGLLSQPSGLAVDSTGNLYIADTGNNRIRKVAPYGNITTVAGSAGAGFAGDNGPATQALLNTPRGVGVDGTNNVYIADTENHRVRRVTPQGVITTVAGSDPARGDNGQAALARLFRPSGLAVDTQGNVYIADTLNHRVRRVNPQGVIVTLAGTGTPGNSGDDGPAVRAQLSSPGGLALDRGGNVYVADTGNHAIRRISPGGGITTFAGTLGQAGNDGDLGQAALAHLRSPNGVAVDASGNVYVADSGNNRVRRVTVGGVIRPLAGDPAGINWAYNGDNIAASTATLNFPFDVAVNSRGAVYIADFLNNRVRRIDPVTGLISTIAGNGNSASAGDGGSGTKAAVDLPLGLAFDAADNLYITDSLGERIRVLAPNGSIRTIAGSGAIGDAGDDGPAIAASLNGPRAIAIDPAGAVIYFSDQDNDRVRLLKPEVAAVRTVTNAASGASGAVAPGEMVNIAGSLLGPTAGASGELNGGFLGTSAGGVRVLFDGVPAPVLASGSTLLKVIVPYSVRGSTSISVEVSGKLIDPIVMPVADAVPGVFVTGSNGRGQILAFNADGSANSAANSAPRGSAIVLYVTGEGQTNPPGVNGKIAGEGTLPAPVLPVTATIGGAAATVAYAGAAPGLSAGLMQVNLIVPDGAPASGAVPVVVSVGTFQSQAGATIAVK